MKTGQKIRFLRTIKGLSQENMADMVGLSRLAYGDIERGKTEPNDERIAQIAEQLGISKDDIEEFGNTVSNFFDQCNSPQVNTGSNNNGDTTTNNYDQRELKHELEKAQLREAKLQLELRLCQAEKEKVEIEVKYWQEKREL
jgi:transcriptional regulator with XRE-family HTH domain